jgi:hypothetical protein
VWRRLRRSLWAAAAGATGRGVLLLLCVLLQLCGGGKVPYVTPPQLMSHRHDLFRPEILSRRPGTWSFFVLSTFNILLVLKQYWCTSLRTSGRCYGSIEIW